MKSNIEIVNKSKTKTETKTGKYTWVKEVVLVVGLMTTLAACSQESPLEKQPPQAVKAFLKQASSYAEHKVHYQLDSYGVMYDACMLGRMHDQPDFCPTLYRNMVVYASTTKGSFKKVTVAELKDQQAYDKRRHAVRFGQLS